MFISYSAYLHSLPVLDVVTSQFGEIDCTVDPVRNPGTSVFLHFGCAGFLQFFDPGDK